MTHPRLKPLLYLICILTDFAGFVVVFAVTRGLAEQHAEPWYLGLTGAGFAFSSGMANLAGGWLAHRFDGRGVFLFGVLTVTLAILLCGQSGAESSWFLPSYWMVGFGLGSVYPTLIGWLNRGEDAHTNHRGVSRTLILFCISWNFGMMGGQLTAGSLFERGADWTYGVALAVAAVNCGLAFIAVRLVSVRWQPAVDVDRQQTESESADVTQVDPRRQLRAARFKRLGWIANLGSTFGGSLLFHLLPDLAVAIGVPADSHGGLLAYWRTVIIGMYLLMHFVNYWHYRFVTSMLSQLLAVIGLVVIATAQSATALLIGLTLHGQLAGYNYFSSLFYSTAGSSHRRRTLAAGIHEATLAAGMAMGTVAGGLLGSLVGHRTPYLLAAVVLSMLMLVQVIVWWRWFAPPEDRSVTPVQSTDCPEGARL